MSMIVVLIGPQGAGKGTQAQLLSEKLGLPIIATGEILRKVAEEETAIGRRVREIQKSGNLVPDEIPAQIVKDRIGLGDCDRGCILDGFPRTLPQAGSLEEMADLKGDRIVAVNVAVPRDMLWKRLAGRRTCATCGATYNIYLKPSKTEDKCDLDQGALLTRNDDTAEAIEQRLALYDEETRPLLEYYRQSGRLHEVDGTGDPMDVFSRIIGLLGVTGIARG
jgi:adenylate kinase